MNHVTSPQNEMRPFESICSGLATLFQGISALLYALVGLSFSALMVVGSWDILVWLLRSNWRSSHFEIPAILLLGMLLLGFMAYAFYLLGRGLRMAAGEEAGDPGTAAYYLMVVAGGLLIITTVLILTGVAQ